MVGDKPLVTIKIDPPGKFLRIGDAPGLDVEPQFADRDEEDDGRADAGSRIGTDRVQTSRVQPALEAFGGDDDEEDQNDGDHTRGKAFTLEDGDRQQAQPAVKFAKAEKKHPGQRQRQGAER